MMFGHLLGWYTTYTLAGSLAPNGILTGAKFTLRPNLAFFYSNVTARHLNSVYQPNFVAFSRGRHLYLAGWPSNWASALVLVVA